MKSSDGMTYPDLPEVKFVKVRFIAEDDQYVEMPVRERGDSWDGDKNTMWNGFDSGKLGYNIPGVLEWNGMKFTVSANLILRGSDSPERKVLGKTNQLLKERKKIVSTLTALDVPKVKHERIVELTQEGMSILEAIEFASAEAIDGHVPPRHDRPTAV